MTDQTGSSPVVPSPLGALSGWAGQSSRRSGCVPAGQRQWRVAARVAKLNRRFVTDLGATVATSFRFLHLFSIWTTPCLHR
jgi:hypothetical protein